MSNPLYKSGSNTLVKVLAITGNGILLSIPEGDFFLNYTDYPWFKHASVNDVFDVEMEGNHAVRWDALDVDLEIESIIYPERYPVIMRSSAELENSSEF